MDILSYRYHTYPVVYRTIIEFVCAGEKQSLEPGEQSEWVFAAVCERGKVRDVHHPGQFAFVMFPKVMLS